MRSHDPRYPRGRSIDLCAITLAVPRKTPRSSDPRGTPRATLRVVFCWPCPGILPDPEDANGCARPRCKGRRRRCIQSVDRLRLGPLNARRTLTPLALRVCTPRYYDTQQPGVYSTPSKNTLRARRRERPVVLSDGPEDGCAVRALSKNHAVTHRAAPLAARSRAAPPASRDQSARRGRRHYVCPPRSRPCQWLRRSRSHGHALNTSCRA